MACSDDMIWIIRESLMIRKAVKRAQILVVLVLGVLMAADIFLCEASYAEIKTSRKWGKEITDAKLNKYNGKDYHWKLPGVDQYACTGYTEWALNSVYGLKVPGYASTRALREYFIKKGNKIVAYGSHVAKAQGGNGKYYSYGEIKPGDIVFFFRRGTGKNGKITAKPLKDSRGYTEVTGWRHVAVIGGSVSGSHGIGSRLHHNTQADGIHYGGTIKSRISIYSDAKGATDYQVMRVIEPEKEKRAIKIRKTMKVNGNTLPEENAVFRIWPKSYGKYSSKSSWWKKIPSEYKDQVTTDKKGCGTSKKLPVKEDGFNGKYYIHQTKGPEIVKLAKNKVITLKKGTSVIEWEYTDDSSEHPSIVKKNALTGETVTQEGVTFRLKRKGAFQSLLAYLGTAGEEVEMKESEDTAGNSEMEESVSLPDKTAEEVVSEENDEEKEETAANAAADPSEVVRAFLSDDPEEELKELGVEIPGSAWSSVGGQDEFVTDESGEAEISAVGKNETGEYEIYETVSPEGYKLPGYSLAALSPDNASVLDRPVAFTLDTVMSTVAAEYSNMPEPEIGTSAADDKTGTHEGTTEKKAGLTDTVYLEGLETGKTYTVFGTLMLKSTGSPLEDSKGSYAEAHTSFKAEGESCECKVSFSFDSRTAAEQEVVVFERLYEGDLDEEPEGTEPIARHEDLSDPDQTVSYPEIPEEPDDEKQDDPPSEMDDEEDQGNKPDDPAKKVNRTYSRPGMPKTGDEQLDLIMLLITVLIASVLILMIVALTYRDNARMEQKKKKDITA